jgi:hypothetical protein
MLHLKCFRALGIRGTVGEQGQGCGERREGQGRGERDFYSVLFRYVWQDSVLFHMRGVGGFTMGTGVRTHSSVGRPGTRITVKLMSYPVAEQNLVNITS